MERSVCSLPNYFPKPLSNIVLLGGFANILRNFLGVSQSLCKPADGLYEEWLSYKAGVTNSSNTIKRHRQHYRKYFEPSVLHEKKIKRIDELMLEQECNRIVKEFHLSRKEWCNIKTILNGMFTYAVRKRYLAETRWIRCRFM